MISVALADVAVINPKAPAKGTIDLDEPVDFVPMAAVSETGSVAISEQRAYREVIKGYTAFIDGDLLVAKITPCFENNKIALARTRTKYAFGSTEFHVIRCDKHRLDPKYAAHFLRFDPVRRAGERQMTGSAGQKRVPKLFLAELEIPLPPLDEQKRIAAILDKADALRRQRQQAIDRLNSLSQSIFHEMFGSVGDRADRWPKGTIRDLLAEAKYGTSKKANSDGRGLPVLRMGNLTYDGSLDLEDLKYVELTEKEMSKHTAKRGDILFNRTNSKELVGKTAVFDRDHPMALAGYLVRARVNERGNPYFISGYLNSRHGKAVLQAMCKNIVGMANINAQEFQDISIGIPPKELQDEYEKRVLGISRHRSFVEGSRTCLDVLFTSLQQRAFAGEL